MTPRQERVTVHTFRELKRACDTARNDPTARYEVRIAGRIEIPTRRVRTFTFPDNVTFVGEEPR